MTGIPNLGEKIDGRKKIDGPLTGCIDFFLND